MGKKKKYPRMSTRTISYHANNHIRKEFVELINCFSLSTLRKGIKTEKDKKCRVKFCKKCLELLGPELWLQRIIFYYDGLTFYHKSDLFSEAIQPKAKIWRKPLKLT